MNQLIQNLLICLSFVVLANASNLKKEPKMPKVQVETVRLIQPPKLSTPLDSSFMPVFLTSNVKASDFTQEMLKSLATNNFIKPSVKLSSINKSNSSSKSNKENLSLKKDKNKSSTVGHESNRWSKAGTSNFSPVLPINLSKMHFDTSGFIPIIPKQATRSSSNAKLIKQASKPISRPNISSQTIVLTKPTQLPKQQLPKSSGSKRNKQISDLAKLIQKSKNVLPNPSIRPLKSIKSNIKLSNLKQTTSSTFKPLAKSAATTLTNTKPISSNAKIIDNRPIAAASSTELKSYLNGQLNSHDARKALLKMNTLRYLAKLSPHWSASSLSETYQTKVGNGPLKAFPISKITIPSGKSSFRMFRSEKNNKIYLFTFDTM